MGFAKFDEEYPWDSLIPYRETAARHPGGTVDLSIGTPVDPTPSQVQRALTLAADAPGYPTVAGTPELREALTGWWSRRRGASLTEAQMLPTIGSKELVGLLPSLLGIGRGDVVVVPEVAYPTYAVGARLAGAKILATNDIHQWRDDPRVRLVWVNSPSNPTGAVLSAAELRTIVAAARGVGAVVASDECYAELPWISPWTETGVPSLLADDVTGGDHTGLLAAYSLSKQSNLAGYRAAFLAGEESLISQISLLRRHLGMMIPAPIQAAMVATLEDDTHVMTQREVYRSRREELLSALETAGFEVDSSDAGLYLWVRKEGLDGWGAVAHFADRGIVVGPGAFYGDAARGHVRISLTAPDERVSQAAHRMRAG